MVLSQNSRPVIPNPYAKPQAKRPRTGEPVRVVERPRQTTSASKANNVPPSNLVSFSNEAIGSVKVYSGGSRISTPSKPLAAAGGAAPDLRLSQNSIGSTKPVDDPYLNQPKNDSPFQGSPTNLNKGGKVGASPPLTARESLLSQYTNCDDEQNDLDLDTSMDWSAAIEEMEQAGSEKKEPSLSQPRACTEDLPSSMQTSHPVPLAAAYSETNASDIRKPEAASGSAEESEHDLDGGLDWSAALEELDKKSSSSIEKVRPSTRTGDSGLPLVHNTAMVHRGTDNNHMAARFNDSVANMSPVTQRVSGSADTNAISSQCVLQDELPQPSSGNSSSTSFPNFDVPASRRAAPNFSSEEQKVGSSIDCAKPLGHDMRPSSWLPPGVASRPGSSSSANGGINGLKGMVRRSAPVPTSTPLSQSQQLLPPPLRYPPERVHPIADEYRQTLVKHADLSAPLLNGWTLYSHQKRAILKGLVMRRTILGLDMGLGKTLIGAVWSKAFSKTFPELRVYVICPVSLKKEWKRTAEEATGLVVVEDNQKEPEPGVHICSWAKIPTLELAQDFKFVVVCDEAHSMQSLQAARTKNALKLMSSKRCLGSLLLTGTPMKNGKPLNLFPLLRAVRHPFGDHQRAYEVHFCAGTDKSYGNRGHIWDASGSSNLPQLNEHISSHLLFMTKEQCLNDLPPRTRSFRKVSVSSRSQLQHNQAVNELAQLYENSHRFENSSDVIIGAVQRVRQIGSFAKIDATVALAKSVLEEEPAVVIFTSFVQVAQNVHKKLAESGWNGELLTGETQPKKRQGMVDNFQAGLSPVFVSTFGAGGVGLTLTAAHTIILLDRPWTPGDAHQAEDRVRRIGQTKPVKSIWMVAFDLDEQIDAVLEQKSQTSNTVLSRAGQGNATTSASAPKISIFQLLKSVLPKQGSGNQSNGVTNNSQYQPR